MVLVYGTAFTPDTPRSSRGRPPKSYNKGGRFPSILVTAASKHWVDLTRNAPAVHLGRSALPSTLSVMPPTIIFTTKNTLSRLPVSVLDMRPLSINVTPVYALKGRLATGHVPNVTLETSLPAICRILPLGYGRFPTLCESARRFESPPFLKPLRAARHRCEPGLARCRPDGGRFLRNGGWFR